MANAGYLLAAFIVAWAVVFGYVLLLVQRQRKLSREIESLKASLQTRETKKQQPPKTG